jgi:hypothetical protein
LYCAGIASVAGDRFDSLSTIFTAPGSATSQLSEKSSLLQSTAKAIPRLDELFKRLPGYERYFTALSDYLFKLLQPRLDDLLFLGSGYEGAFDDFEILLALSSADQGASAREGRFWGPIGRFGWKENRSSDQPFSRLVAEAKRAGANWGPLRAGLFEGSIERFKTAAEAFVPRLSREMYI